MKGLAPLFLGIFGTFAFSWVGLTVIPNWQIGHLNPQSDEEGTDIYPMPQSGMFERGARVYAANGCIYCHSQQVRADYAAADIERKWGDRRSAPRDYIFERPVSLGKMRMGQDLANVGARAPKEEEAASATPPGAASPAAPPAPQGSAPAPAAAPSGANPSPGLSPAKTGSPPPPASPPPKATASPAPAGSPPAAAGSPTASPASPAPKAPAAPSPNAPPASPSPSAVANASPAAGSSPGPVPTSGESAIYSAAWHHLHLYSPRSINVDSNMPSYRFLYQTRRITDAPSADALKLTGSEAPPEGWEIVPTFDAKCLVAYLMSLNQSHPLKEVRSTAPAAAASPSPAAGK